jgi:hypothetical protein
MRAEERDDTVRDARRRRGSGGGGRGRTRRHFVTVLNLLLTYKTVEAS